jgi:hypothetical protein
MGKTNKAHGSAKSREFVGGYEVLGRTDDGVPILKPKGKPTSFSVARLKKAIRKTCVKKNAG